MMIASKGKDEIHPLNPTDAIAMPANTAADGTQGSTPSSLIVGIRNREAAAWQRFNVVFGSLIYGWLRRKGLQPADAADVVQEVQRSVLLSIDSFRRDRPADSFQGWVWTITQSRLADHFRQRKKEQPAATLQLDAGQVGALPGAPDSVDAQPNDWRAELTRRLIKLLEPEFQPSSWQSFWRMVAHGESADQIARDLGISAAAVRQAKYRVLQRLRTELAELTENPQPRR
jgi:RNA polymerase sigma-70 factor (ECF subfamily)